MPFKRLICLCMTSALFSPVVNANVTEQDFVATTTQNLINLCTASPQDPNYQKAIHFCQGYLVGAVHFHLSETAGKPQYQLFCFPEPRPTRNEAIDQFIAWAKQHPEYMNESPVDTEFRFLTETWPCVK
ncbi:Rap1a/Tai family immunity protein [Methylomonas sp. MgM2]